MLIHLLPLSACSVTNGSPAPKIVHPSLQQQQFSIKASRVSTKTADSAPTPTSYSRQYLRATDTLSPQSLLHH